VGSLLFAVGFGRHDRDRSHGLDVIEDGLTVVSLVGQDPLGVSLSEQFDGLGAVVDLTAGHQKVHGQAHFVGQQMDLRCQASSGAPQSLVHAPFCGPSPPAGGARTIVE
jgi:hypothetical protein